MISRICIIKWVISYRFDKLLRTYIAIFCCHFLKMFIISHQIGTFLFVNDCYDVKKETFSFSPIKVHINLEDFFAMVSFIRDFPGYFQLWDGIWRRKLTTRAVNFSRLDSKKKF